MRRSENKSRAELHTVLEFEVEEYVYEGEDTILACLFSDTILAARSCDIRLIFD